MATNSKLSIYAVLFMLKYLQQTKNDRYHFNNKICNLSTNNEAG